MSEREREREREREKSIKEIPTFLKKNLQNAPAGNFNPAAPLPYLK